MPTNQQIIEKAAMTLADLASGGQMNVQQSKKFLRMVQDQPTIIRDSRFVQMESDSRKVEKLGFGSRILRAATEGTALADNQRSVPTSDTVQLNTKEVIAEVNITYDTLENNIEGKNLKNTIMQMIAERASLDLEELILNGDTASADAYLALIDGLRKQTTSHVVNAAGAAIDKTVFKNLVKAVPNKYIRNKRKWRYYVSYNNETEWIDQVGDRLTSWGDSALKDGGKLQAYGVPVQGVAMLQPYDQDGAGTGTTMVSDALFTHPKNIIIGMNRKISIEVDKDIRERKFIIVLTAKIDAKYEEELAAGKAINILEQ